MLKLLADKYMKNFELTLSYVATLPEKTLTTKMNDFVCCFPLKSVSGSEKELVRSRRRSTEIYGKCSK